MTITRSRPISSGFPTALDDRKLDSGLFPREGVMPDPTTLANGGNGVAYANGGWNVGANPCVIVSKRGAAPFTKTYGAARVANDAVGTAWTVGSAPVSGSRRDRLWVRITDPDQGEATTTTDGPLGAARAVPVWGVTAGTDTANTMGALPAGAVEIAQVTIPTGAASIAGATIVHTHGFAHVMGGKQYFRTAVALLASVTGNAEGETAYALDTKAEYRWNGAAWIASTAAGTRRLLGAAKVLSASSTTLTGSYADVAGATVTATSSGGVVRVHADMLLSNANSGAAQNGWVQLLCDGVVVGEATNPPYILFLSSGGQAPAQAVIEVTHTPAAGSHVWKLQAHAGGPGAVVVYQPNITVEEIS